MTDFGNWNLPLQVREHLERVGLVSANSILLCSESELSKVGNLSREESEIVKNEAAKSILKYPFITALDSSQIKWQRLSVGCLKLDKFLKGGIALQGITEVTGGSSSGKTQLCLQVSLTVQYPYSCGGLEAGAVYICTEDAFPSRRLHQLCTDFPSTYQYSDSTVESRFGNNILIEHIADSEGLKECIIERLPRLLSQKKIGLIVVDSIAAVFRADYEQSTAVNRAKELRMIGSSLHLLAEKHHLAVICVNQVTNIMGSVPSGSNRTVAALGLAWANVVTTRLLLSRTHRSIPDPHSCGLTLPVRTLEVVFSPDLAPEKCQFTVTANGVVGID